MAFILILSFIFYHNFYIRYFFFFSLPYSKPRVIKILHFVSPFFLRCRVSSTPPQRPHDRRRRPRRSPRPTPTSENPQSSPHRRRLSTVSVLSFFIPFFFGGGRFMVFVLFLLILAFSYFRCFVWMTFLHPLLVFSYFLSLF